MNISLVIYCQDPPALSNIYDLVSTYAPFFAQCLIVLNIPSKTPLPALYPADLRRVSVLQMPDQIDAGAAIGKLFSHLYCDKVFLIDSRISMKKDVLSLLRHSQEYALDNLACIVSFQPQVRYAPWHSPSRQGSPWNADFRFVTTASWGALLFDRNHVLSLGSFDPQLSDEALMIDLSWKAQKSQGLLLETQETFVTLKEPYTPSPLELRLLTAKYPLLYPSWRSALQKFGNWLLKSPQPQSPPLN